MTVTCETRTFVPDTLATRIRPCWMILWPCTCTVGTEVRAPSRRGGGPEPECCCCCCRRVAICCGVTAMGYNTQTSKKGIHFKTKILFLWVKQQFKQCIPVSLWLRVAWLRYYESRAWRPALHLEPKEEEWLSLSFGWRPEINPRI